MKVAVIVTELGRGVGGRYTFQESLLAGIGRLRDETHHEFVPYSAGISRHSVGSRTWLARRAGTVAATLAIQGLRDTQDRLGKRLVHVRTSLERRLAGGGIDLVWFPTIYAEDVDLPYVCTMFDVEHRLKPWFPEVSRRGEFERRERFNRRYLPKATRVIVPNSTGREQVERFYRVPPENCLVLPHPTPDFALWAADEPRRDASALRAHGIREPFLFYPAQFWPHKNHKAALDALAELHRRGTSLSLVCVGSDKGQRETVLAQARARGVESHTHLIGFVADDELVALYQRAHALLYLSRFGPENLPPLEAFALGCPVVAADVPGAQSQLGDAAVLVDSADPVAVANAVEAVGEPSQRKQLVADGDARAREWTADDYVRGVIGFLDEFENERQLWA